MRVLDGAKQLHVRELGPVPCIEVLREKVLALDLTAEDTITTEQVFYGTHRIVATSDLATTPQKHARGARSSELRELSEPLVEWLKSIYPGCVPVLIQCATLPVGAELSWHVDSYLYQNEAHKVHVPIVTGDGVLYQSRAFGRQVDSHFEVGQAYEINNILFHRAVNHSLVPRTHVIVDMMPAKALQGYLDRGVDIFFTHHAANTRLEALLKENYAAA